MKYSKEYKYKVGDVVTTKNGKIEILECIRMENTNKRGYCYKCLVDRSIDYITEYNLVDGKGCPVCANKKVVKGINDIATTHPHLVKYFVNIEDAYSHTYSSGKKVLMKCPDCGCEKEYRIATVTSYKFSCNFCSDGISYGEKIILNILEQLKQNIITQYNNFWCKDKRYDIFLNNEIIIEIHGMQHYEEDKFNMDGCRTLKEEQENDKLKKELAINNGIKEENYIVIDCRYSELEWVKDSILNSKLSKLFDLSKIDWLKANKFALSSNILKACDLWNKGMKSAKEIANILYVSDDSIRKWLNKCQKNNMCDYDGKYNSNNATSIMIRNTFTSKDYNSISQASRLLKISRKTLSKYINDINDKEWIIIKK